MIDVGPFAYVQLLAAELSEGSVDLPGFPRIFAQVCQALDEPKNTNEQTANIISSEPALAARVLMMANSFAFTHSGKTISDLRSAVIRLGNHNVRSAATAFAVSQVKHQPFLMPVQSRLEELWRRSIHVAAISHVLGRTCKLNADEAHLTGLLHAIGTLYLIVRTAQRVDLFPIGGDDTELHERWNAPVTKSILENWDFPEPIIHASGNQDEWDRKHVGKADLTDVLICAKALFVCHGDAGLIKVSLARIPAFQKLERTQDHCEAILVDAKQQMETMREALHA